MSFRVFYAWQSDTPNALNRSFIEAAIEAVLRAIAKDYNLEGRPEIDQDRRNVPGTPDIARVIMDKIDSSALVVGDLTLIGRTDLSDRLTPNPNVVFELGYAVGKKDWDRVIFVMNTAYGKPDQQIFDIRGRSFVTYNLTDKGDAERTAREKSGLVSQLRDAIEMIVEQRQLLSDSMDEDEHVIEQMDETIKSNDIRGLHKLITEKARALVTLFRSDEFPTWEKSITASDVEKRLEAYTAATDPLLKPIAHGGQWGTERQHRVWKDCIEILAQLPARPGGWSHEYEISRCLRLYPALLSFYAVGMGALVGWQFGTLGFLFHEVQIPFEDTLEEATVALTPWEVFARAKHNYVGGHGRYVGLKAPLSLCLYDTLQPKIEPFLNRPADYPEIFYDFEYLLGLSSLVSIERGIDGRDRRDAFVGKFAARYEALEVPDRMEAELEKMKEDWPPLKFGVIPCSYAECKEMMRLYRIEVELFRDNHRHRFRSDKYPVR